MRQRAFSCLPAFASLFPWGTSSSSMDSRQVSGGRIRMRSDRVSGSHSRISRTSPAAISRKIWLILSRVNGENSPLTSMMWAGCRSMIPLCLKRFGFENRLEGCYSKCDARFILFSMKYPKPAWWKAVERYSREKGRRSKGIGGGRSGRGVLNRLTIKI